MFFVVSSLPPPFLVLSVPQPLIRNLPLDFHVTYGFSLKESLSNLFSNIILQTNAGNEPDLEDEQVCCEALEVMTLCFALIPTALDALSKDKGWQTFIIDLLLHCHSK